MFDIVAEVRRLTEGPPAPSPDELLAQMITAQRLINALTAAQLDRVWSFAACRPAPDVPEECGGGQARREDVSEFASAEIACVLHLTPRAADRLLDTALDLAQIPRAAAAMRAGDLDLRRVRVLLDATRDLPAEAVAEVEALVVPAAAEQTVPQLARAVRRAALRIAPGAVEERRRVIAAERSAWVEHDGDGRSRLCAQGPTAEVLRIFTAIDALARKERPEGGLLPARRFDVLSGMADAILADPALPRTRLGAPGIVLVADPVRVALLESGGGGAGDPSGRSGRPVELLGDGPLPDGLAAELLGHPNAVVLTAGPTAQWPCDHTGGYAVPDRLARYVTALHRRCAFPGCGVPAHRCDLDHVTAWPGGPTCACNLMPLCRHHHRLKTHASWRVAMHPDHRVEWTSPTGRRFRVNPDDGGAA